MTKMTIIRTIVHAGETPRVTTSGGESHHGAAYGAVSKQKREISSKWWEGLGKYSRGSRPRCVLLVDGDRSEVAKRLTQRVNCRDVAVSSSHKWMPCGKPLYRNGKWDDAPAKELDLIKKNNFLPSGVQRRSSEVVASSRQSRQDADLGHRQHLRNRGQAGTSPRRSQSARERIESSRRVEQPKKSPTNRPSDSGGERWVGASDRKPLAPIPRQSLSAIQQVRLGVEAGLAWRSRCSRLSRISERAGYGERAAVVPLLYRLGACSQNLRRRRC